MELTLNAIEPNIISMSKANQTLMQVGTAVLAQNLDTAETIGDTMTKMMEQSVNPSVGSNFDMSV
ncbi:YjfB family protein [Eubacterium oxidoreducens]|uniref:Putative motility protein n=1 Tax=Eubacterium oxidoreducens TaxID=1732 RepID=A0A1G6CD02_EUBOX|nr:YjfB family protein [Eubacterium oxidoreducens]SDB30755.1 Putative motility protein [Eubacterium oxidoreducens]